jgi:predicted AlkP superfamily pyrophosphatase or phosphodiesterase
MKIRFLHAILIISCFANSSYGQKVNKTAPIQNNETFSRPKLVVGLVVDQMRWDYLYRFQKRYTDGGFKRLLREGFSAENTLIPYTPTHTACGHATIYTGSVPAINGIIANNWFDPQAGRDVYCVEDKEVKTVGSTSTAGQMSPKNLLVTTVTDELRMATNFRSKVISVSQKDRGSILPAGHTGNGAYWYDSKTGSYISSTHYMQELPEWVVNFNAQKLPNQFLEKDWHTLFPIDTYVESTADDKSYERMFAGAKSSTFPHLFKQYVNKNYGMLTSMPYGNTYTLEFAKQAVQYEKMGQTGNTDFLAISLSSTDYVGHQFGPNSVELEDTYLRLDRDISDFLTYLDKSLGKGNYTLFLTADHAATHIPGYSRENKMPGGVISSRKIKNSLDSLIKKEFDVDKAIFNFSANQIIFDRESIKEEEADYDKIKQACIDYLVKQDGILNAVDLKNINGASIPQEIKTKLINGYNARRSGDVYVLFDSGWYTSNVGTGHGAWNPYDSHIPAVFMGWGIKQGKSNQRYYMTDITPTLSALLHIQEPSGSIGNVITELLK